MASSSTVATFLVQLFASVYVNVHVNVNKCKCLSWWWLHSRYMNHDAHLTASVVAEPDCEPVEG